MIEGSSLWLNEKKSKADWCSICLHHPYFEHFMLEYHLKQFRYRPPSTHKDFKNYLDPQWQFAVAVKEFTPHHFIVTKKSSVNIPDE